MATSTKSLRESLAKHLASAAAGGEVLVTRRGKPYVRLVAARPLATAPAVKYPLRGTLVATAGDFDEPMPEIWEALKP